MSATLQRRPLTDQMLTLLAAIGKPVGDGVLPNSALWMGQPNVPGSVFEPFVVLSELLASRSTGPLTDSQADWQLPYMLSSFGVYREQAGWMADKARVAFDSLANTGITLGPDTYLVQQVHLDTIGAPSRADVADPPIWSVQDAVSIWVTKEIS